MVNFHFSISRRSVNKHGMNTRSEPIAGLDSDLSKHMQEVKVMWPCLMQKNVDGKVCQFFKLGGSRSAFQGYVVVVKHSTKNHNYISVVCVAYSPIDSDPKNCKHRQISLEPCWPDWTMATAKRLGLRITDLGSQRSALFQLRSTKLTVACW